MAISVFDLFKIGIGPSSSHTVGPMRAAALFTAALRQRQALSAVRRLEVRLYGSLSATGVGHGTDRAVIMGLMGEWPDRIDPTQIAPRMAALLDSGLLQLDGRVAVPFDWVRDMRLLDENLPYHPNAMTLVAYSEQGELHQETYYSVGGGFVVDAAQAASGQLDQDHTVLPYDFSSAEELLLLCKRHNLRVSELMLANERIWRSETDIREGLRRIWQAMRDCVDNGLRNEGILPGGLNVQRRAARLHRNLQEIGKPNVIGSTLSAMEWVQPVRPGGERGERRRRAHGHRAHQRRGGDHPGGAALLYEVQSRRPGPRRRRLPAGRRRGGHPVQEERLDLRRRGRLPGRGRLGLRDGRRRIGGSPRRHPRRSRTPPRSAWSTTSG